MPALNFASPQTLIDSIAANYYEPHTIAVCKTVVLIHRVSIRRPQHEQFGVVFPHPQRPDEQCEFWFNRFYEGLREYKKAVRFFHPACL